jgi:hypothetical protein
MVDLNHENAVHRQSMRWLEEQRVNERSAKLARQGNQLVYRSGGEHRSFSTRRGVPCPARSTRS